MKKNLKITPEGTKDYLFKECTAVDYVCQKIQKVFENHQFHRVITPALEYYDLFSTDSSGISPESMFKTTDNTGRIVAVRPDSTLPIARLVSTRMQNEVLPVRLFYNQAVYRNNPSLTGRSNEIMQMGIELIGSKGKRADLEVITTAIQSMQAVSDDFRIEVGHSLIFNSLLNSLKADEDIKEQIRVYIENKNYSALNDILDKLEDSDTSLAIRTVPSLFGGEEVFEKAEKIIKNEKALEAIDYLKSLYKDLATLDMGDKIIVDLGLVQHNDYYSGFVFTGYVLGYGDAILSGGRYDKIFDEFNCSMGASGFAININHLAEEARCYSESNIPEVLVFARNDSDIMKAIEYTAKLVKEGTRAQFSDLSDENEARKFAENLGIKKFEIVGD
ncbi:MAG: ATP phosphoribosyltransferase regulatory subunit [Ruminococcus sp.]|nr:ATP phosphoribosyltransferase regulatory subunit [Ruminococcus sp.]